MQIVLETDEAWSLMSVIVSYVIDHAGISSDGKTKVRMWRTERALGTVEMDGLAVAMNEALGTYIDERLERKLKRRGRYVSTSEVAR